MWMCNGRSEREWGWKCGEGWRLGEEALVASGRGISAVQTLDVLAGQALGAIDTRRSHLNLRHVLRVRTRRSVKEEATGVWRYSISRSLYTVFGGSRWDVEPQRETLFHCGRC